MGISIHNLQRKLTPLPKLNRFYFKVEGLDDLLRPYKQDALFFYSRAITVPSRMINTDQYTYANGFRREIPSGSTFGDGNITIQMFLDDDYEIYELFVKWMDKVHNMNNGYLSFEDDYTADLNIFQLPSRSNILNGDQTEISLGTNDTASSFKFKLGKCFPKSISAIDYSHESTDYAKINVNIAYCNVEYISTTTEENVDKTFPALNPPATTTNGVNGDELLSDIVNSYDTSTRGFSRPF